MEFSNCKYAVFEKSKFPYFSLIHHASWLLFAAFIEYCVHDIARERGGMSSVE